MGEIRDRKTTCSRADDLRRRGKGGALEAAVMSGATTTKCGFPFSRSALRTSRFSKMVETCQVRPAYSPNLLARARRASSCRA